jgi:flagellar protein FlaG
MIERLSPTSSALYSGELKGKVTQQESNDIEIKGVKQEKLNKEQLEEVVRGLNEFIQPTHTSIKFELHEQSKEHYVKVIDEHTEEVIREIPSREILDIYAAMTQFLGLMFDKKA